MMMLPTIAMGFGVPAVSMHYLDPLAAFVISGIFVLLALGLGVVTVTVGIEQLHFEEINAYRNEREKLQLLRAHFRATLEELDNIIVVLKEIRDILKSVEGGM